MPSILKLSQIRIVILWGGISRLMETKSLEIKEGNVTDNLRAIGALLPLHWEESARNKQLMVLKPDYDKYKNMDKMGKLLGVFAYYEDVIVGYSVNIIDYHLHYSDLKVCSNDVLFLDPLFRDTSLGLRLMKTTKELAKSKGAKMMLWHAKEDTALDKIMQ